MQNFKRKTISKMNLFNQNYHIQVRRHKLQLKKKRGVQKGFYGNRGRIWISI